MLRRGRGRHRADAELRLQDARLAQPGFTRRGHAPRPAYRRLVDNIPVRYVGFTVPDEFFVGYGFDLGDDRYRHLPDLRIAKAS